MTMDVSSGRSARDNTIPVMTTEVSSGRSARDNKIPVMAMVMASGRSARDNKMPVMTMAMASDPGRQRVPGRLNYSLLSPREILFFLLTQ